MIALRNFVGVVRGKERQYRVGDIISQKDAKELGLAGKPELAGVKNEAESTSDD